MTQTNLETIQASCDVLDQLLESKEVELQQAIDGINQLRQAVKDASNKSSSESQPAPNKKTGKKSTGVKPVKDRKKKKAAAVVEESTLEEDEEDNGLGSSSGSEKQGLMGSVAEQSTLLLQQAINGRGYFIFGIAVAAIYYYGDYASV